VDAKEESSTNTREGRKEGTRSCTERERELKDEKNSPAFLQSNHTVISRGMAFMKDRVVSKNPLPLPIMTLPPPKAKDSNVDYSEPNYSSLFFQ
jgi:hypothetical protein